MAEGFTPVGNTGNQVNPLQSISGLLGISQQSKQLQLQGQELAQQKIRTQEATGVNDFFTNWDPSQHIAADGTTDIDSAMGSSAFQNIPGVARSAVIAKLNAIKGQQIQNTQGLMTLGMQGLDAVGRTLGAWVNDPDVVAGNENGKAKVRAAMDSSIQQFGPAGAKALLPFKNIADGDIKPGELPIRLRAVQQQGMQAAQTLAAQTAQASPIQTTAGVQQINVNPNAPQPVGSPMGAPTVNAPPPGLVTTPAGPIARTTPGGGLIPLGGGNAAPTQTAGAPAPNLNATRAQVETQVGLSKGVTERVTQAQNAANNTIQAQDALSRVKAILEGPEAPNTGAAFDRARGLQNLFASAGIDTHGATDMNGLVKNLARYEASRATAAGLGGTDAARELSHNGQPNVSIDSRALRGIVDQSLATEKAIAAYANVQAKTQDPAKLQQNEAAFRSIPHLIEGYQYGMSRNADEANRFLGEHGLKPQDMAQTRRAIKQFESQ
jgi:hypothetical protein